VYGSQYIDMYMQENELEQLLSGHSDVQVCHHWKCGEIDIRDSDNGDPHITFK